MKIQQKLSPLMYQAHCKHFAYYDPLKSPRRLERGFRGEVKLTSEWGGIQ